MFLTKIHGYGKKIWWRLISIDDSPPKIAWGAAFGFYLGFTPFFGLQTLAALLGAMMFRINKVAAVAGVHLHDPVFYSLPFVLWQIEFLIGSWILGNQDHIYIFDRFFWVNVHQVLGPILLGSLVIGLPSSFILYKVVLKGAQIFQERFTPEKDITKGQV